MKERGRTLADEQQDGSVEGRRVAWRGAIKMAERYPLTGVGLGSFMCALQDFIDTNPRVAHNTFFQFLGENGVGAAFCYVMIICTFLISSRRIGAWCKARTGHPDLPVVEQLNNASTASFLGLVVCSFFLTLNNYEIFYYLVIINSALTVLCLRSSAKEASPVEEAQTSGFPLPA